MPTIISRAEANLPPVPSSVGTRSLSSWTGIKVHHTGGAFSSWRAIHDWQTEGRPDDEELIYIGYSFGIAGGRVTELRGWTRSPAHDHENSTIGVVLGGNYQNALPPEEDLEALVWFCREARLRTGKRLPITGHRDTWPRGDSRYSTCPGDRLYAWLPTLRARVDNEEDDVTPEDIAKIAKATVKELEARRFARADGKGSIGLFSATEWARKHAADAKDGVLEKLVPGQAAILAALAGDSADAIVAKLDELAAEERQRDEAALDDLVQRLDQAAMERAEIAELIGQAQSGQLNAEDVVRRIGEKLAAAGGDGS